MGSPRNGADDHDGELGGVAGQQVLDELADVVVDDAALFDGGDDRREVVVEQHHVRRLFGDVGTGDSHRHPDVRLFEGGGIVDTVAGHRSRGAVCAIGGDQTQLVLG